MLTQTETPALESALSYTRLEINGMTSYHVVVPYVRPQGSWCKELTEAAPNTIWNSDLTEMGSEFLAPAPHPSETICLVLVKGPLYSSKYAQNWGESNGLVAASPYHLMAFARKVRDPNEWLGLGLGDRGPGIVATEHCGDWRREKSLGFWYIKGHPPRATKVYSGDSLLGRTLYAFVAEPWRPA
jgi:hypothetical protein